MTGQGPNLILNDKAKECFYGDDDGLTADEQQNLYESLGTHPPRRLRDAPSRAPAGEPFRPPLCVLAEGQDKTVPLLFAK